LENEKSDHAMKLNEQIARHDNFVIASKNEKENLIWLHSRHCRLLASKSIGLELSKIVNKRLNQALTELNCTI
jgi:hypothetical protein